MAGKPTVEEIAEIERLYKYWDEQFENSNIQNISLSALRLIIDTVALLRQWSNHSEIEAKLALLHEKLKFEITKKEKCEK